MKGYVDGALVGEKTFTDFSELNWPRGSVAPYDAVPTWNTLDVGQSTSGGSEGECLVSDARLYDTAISQADITALAGTNPATTGRYAETFSTPVVW